MSIMKKGLLRSYVLRSQSTEVLRMMSVWYAAFGYTRLTPFSFTAVFLEPGRYAARCFPEAAVGGARADVRVEQVGGGAVVV